MRLIGFGAEMELNSSGTGLTLINSEGEFSIQCLGIDCGGAGQFNAIGEGTTSMITEGESSQTLFSDGTTTIFGEGSYRFQSPTKYFQAKTCGTGSAGFATGNGTSLSSDSIAIGDDAIVNVASRGSIAIGAKAITQGYGSISMGNGIVNAGAGNISIGNLAENLGSGGSIAIGNTSAVGAAAGAIAFGNGAGTGASAGAIAMGNGAATDNGTNQIAIGNHVLAEKNSAIAVGDYA